MSYGELILTVWLIALTIVVWRMKHRNPTSELAERLRAQNDRLENAIKPKQEDR